jgi:hypothetical protein
MAKIGRPPIDEATRKDSHLSIRISNSLRERLEIACKEEDRTISQEVELRLQRSFEEPTQPIRERLGGPTTYWLFLIMGNQIRILENNFTGERWWRDPYTHRQAKTLINSMMDFFKPTGRVRTPRRFMGIDQSLGQHLAEREMANIESTLLYNDPPIEQAQLPGNIRAERWGGIVWGGMTIGDWREAAKLFKGKLKQSPLAKLYGIERSGK